MFKINNQQALFNLTLANAKNKDLEDIKKQLAPFDIDEKGFIEHYVQTKKQDGELCDCKMHELARIYEAQGTKLTPELVTYLQTQNIRNCKQDDYAKVQLGY